MIEKNYQKEEEIKLQELDELKQKWEKELEDLRQIKEKYKILLTNLHEMRKVKEKMM